MRVERLIRNAVMVSFSLGLVLLFLYYTHVPFDKINPGEREVAARKSRIERHELMIQSMRADAFGQSRDNETILVQRGRLEIQSSLKDIKDKSIVDIIGKDKYSLLRKKNQVIKTNLVDAKLTKQTTNNIPGNVTRTSIKKRQILNETIAILTPISNSEMRLERYFNVVRSLDYPKKLMSLVLGEDSSTDLTISVAKRFLKEAAKDLHRTKLLHFNDSFYQFQDWAEVHDQKNQLKRRRHLAHARNHLVMDGLEDETWVLWMDSDIKSVPTDLIQQLLSAEKDIVVPSCLFIDDKGERHLYDRNTWRETEKSKAFLKSKDKNFLMLEGYDNPLRLFLPALKNEGEVVEIDGVGGCVLLIKAIHHKHGLIFPSFIFENHIETEGLARMAQAMGLKLYGMPSLEVFHS